MNKIITLLATAFFLTGCTQSPLSSLVGDTRFVKTGAHLGLDTEELVDTIGYPIEIVPKGCTVPLLHSGEAPIVVPGDSWLYAAKGESAQAHLLLCIVAGYVVAEEAKYIRIEDGVITIGATEVVDMGVLREVVKDALKSAIEKEKQFPSNGPKLSL